MRIEEHVAHLRSKPEHVRSRIVMGTSVGVTALVGVIWVAAMTSSGTFALGNGPQDVAQSDTQTPSSDAFALSGTNVKSNISQLVGAVNAATGATTSSPALTIVDGQTTSSFNQPTAQPANSNPTATVIPF
jgi:hypothetical protein